MPKYLGAPPCIGIPQALAYYVQLQSLLVSLRMLSYHATHDHTPQGLSCTTSLTVHTLRDASGGFLSILVVNDPGTQPSVRRYTDSPTGSSSGVEKQAKKPNSHANLLVTRVLQGATVLH